MKKMRQLLVALGFIGIVLMMWRAWTGTRPGEPLWPPKEHRTDRAE